MKSNGWINFSEPKQSGNFKKVNITDPFGVKVMVQTESCFSWGVQADRARDSYSMPLVLGKDSKTVKTLKMILQKCKDYLPGREFGKCLYENNERGTVTIYPKLKCFKGNFSTSIYEGDNEVDPRKYLNKRCNVIAMVQVEGILIGERTTLLVKVLEV